MRTRYFYLEDGINKVDLMDVGRLAAFALTLEPYTQINISKGEGYVVALYNYMNKNKDNLLFNSYNLINSDKSGKELLYTNIELCLLEQSFRKEGADENSIKKYVAIFKKYHELLDYNNNTYNPQKNKSK